MASVEALSMENVTYPGCNVLLPNVLASPTHFDCVRISVLNTFSSLFSTYLILAYYLHARYVLDPYIFPLVFGKRYIALDDSNRRQICTSALNLVSKVLSLSLFLNPALDAIFLNGDWAAVNLHDGAFYAAFQLSAFRAFEIIYDSNLRKIVIVHHAAVVLTIQGFWAWMVRVKAVMDQERSEEIRSVVIVTTIWVLIDHISGSIAITHVYRKLFPESKNWIRRLYGWTFFAASTILLLEVTLVLFTTYMHRETLAFLHIGIILALQVLFTGTKSTTVRILRATYKRLCQESAEKLAKKE